MWTRSFTIQNLYDAVLPITRNTYPIKISNTPTITLEKLFNKLYANNLFDSRLFCKKTGFACVINKENVTTVVATYTINVLHNLFIK